jgi:hypothetical protein
MEPLRSLFPVPLACYRAKTTVLRDMTLVTSVARDSPAVCEQGTLSIAMNLSPSGMLSVAPSGITDIDGRFSRLPCHLVCIYYGYT